MIQYHAQTVRFARTLPFVALFTLVLVLSACGGSNSGGGTVSIPGLIGGSIQTAPLTLTGTVTTYAGSTSGGYVDGTGTAAAFNSPWGVTTDGTNLYVADRNNCAIRKIVINTAAVTTLAGGTCGSANGTGTLAQFNSPWGITTDGTNLYVADTGNEEIRKIVIKTGKVTTLAGTAGVAGATDGTGSAASFNRPIDITTDGTNLYVADTDNNKIREIVIKTGKVTTLAGSGTAGTADGTGTAAQFDAPYGVTTDGTNLYVADDVSYLVRKVVISSGVVTTLAGQANVCGSTNGTGTLATFCDPTGITTDGTNLYMSDFKNNEIRKIVIATGAVTTLAGSTTSGSADGTGSSAQFNNPAGITTDGTSLYVMDWGNEEVRKIQ